MEKAKRGTITIAEHCPWLISEWHAIKNGDYTPYNVSHGTKKKYWWKCSVCNYEWLASPLNRSYSGGCPACSGRAVFKGFNDFATKHPELVPEWNYEKNILTPDSITACSSKRVWWHCSTCGFDWLASINNKS